MEADKGDPARASQDDVEYIVWEKTVINGVQCYTADLLDELDTPVRG